MARLANLPAIGRPAPSRPARIAIRRVLSGRAGIRIVSIVIVLALWQLIGSHYPYSMSSPWAVARATHTYLGSQVLPAFGQTLEAFWIAFAISVCAGVPIGLAMARLRVVRVALEPYVVMFYSLPMLSIFPLLILAFGINFELRVAASVLFGIFAIITNTFIGASRIDPALEDVCHSFCASGWKRLTTVIFPGSLDYIFAGVRVGFGHAMIGAVVIEMEASVVGTGSLLQRYAQNLQLAPFFVVVVVLGLFSVLFNVVLQRVQRWTTAPWSRSRLLGRSAVGRSLTRASNSAVSSAFGQRCGSARRALAGVNRTVATALTPVGRPVRRLGRLLTTRVGAWALRIAIVVGIVAFWNNAAQSVSRAVLPTPSAVLSALYHLIFVGHEIVHPLLQSLALFGAGFALSLLIGIPVGLAMGQNRIVEHALDPYVAFLYALPIVVFVPIMVIWLGFGFNFGIAFVVISAVFAVIINTMQGVHSVDPELIAMARSFCASERSILRSVVIPSAVPFMIAGARLAFSISWIGVIVSEVISSQTGLGGAINSYATAFQLADMFVPMLLIIAISVIIVGLSDRFAPKLTPWFQEEK